MTFDFDKTLSNASKKYQALYEEVKDRFNVYILNYVTSYYYHTQKKSDREKYIYFKGLKVLHRAWDNRWYCNFIASTALRYYIRILHDNRKCENIINYLFMIIKKRYNICYPSKRWEKLESMRKKERKTKSKLLKLQSDARKHANKQIKPILKEIEVIMKTRLKDKKRNLYYNIYDALMRGDTIEGVSKTLGYKTTDTVKDAVKWLKDYDVYKYFDIVRKTNKKAETNLSTSKNVEYLTKRYAESYTINKCSNKLKTLNIEINEFRAIYEGFYSIRALNKNIDEFIENYLLTFGIELKPTNPKKDKPKRLTKQEILNLLNNIPEHLTFREKYRIICGEVVQVCDNNGHYIEDALDIIFKECRYALKINTA